MKELTPTTTDQRVLEIQSLKTYFFTSTGTVRAVDGIDIWIQAGEAVGLIGESGCGKSQTAYSIMRLIAIPGRVFDGKILFKGIDLLRLPEEEMRRVRGREIAMVFQDPMTFLNPIMKIGDQIAENILAHDPNAKHAKKKAMELLTMVGMPSASRIIDYFPHQLSGGMRQRVLLASALSCEPPLLIADEPTTALDVSVQAQVLDLIKDLRSKLGFSLLLITHDLGIVADICDRVYVMYAGKIVEHSTTLEIFENHKHPYTTGLLESVLSIDQFRKELVSIEGDVPDLTNPPAGCRFNPRCKECMTICREKEPLLQEVGSKMPHRVACWLYS